jgi:hypothetical protein
MIHLPQTPELLAVAERVVWFQPPAKTLAEPIRFLAHVMTYGTLSDLRALDGLVGRDDLREAIANAPAGVFDERSWAFWNLKLGFAPSLPLPVRSFSC